MRCIKCGAIMDINVAFCGRCGTNSRVSKQQGTRSQPQHSGGGVSAPSAVARSDNPLNGKCKIECGIKKASFALGFGIASVVLGFNGAFMSGIFGGLFGSIAAALAGPILGFVIGLIAVPLGGGARKKLTDEYQKFYVALAGKILGYIGIAVSLLALVYWLFELLIIYYFFS